MGLEVVKRKEIIDLRLEEFILAKINDGKNNVFIEHEELENGMFDIPEVLGETEYDGIKVIKKLGLVYLKDKNLGLIEKSTQIHLIVPELKYIKNKEKITTIDNVTIYNQYKVIVSDDKGNTYNLVLVSYLKSI